MNKFWTIQLITISEDVKISNMLILSWRNSYLLLIVWERRETNIKNPATEKAEGRRNKPILKKI